MAAVKGSHDSAVGLRSPKPKLTMHVQVAKVTAPLHLSEAGRRQEAWDSDKWNRSVRGHRAIQNTGWKQSPPSPTGESSQVPACPAPQGCLTGRWESVLA